MTPAMLTFAGDARQYVAVADNAALDTANGAIAFQFEADSARGDQVLFAKNGYGKDEGDLTIGVADGRVYARLETGTTSYTVTSCDDIGCGWRQLAFSFGADGMKLYLDGALVDANSYSGGLANNRQAIVIGASDEANRNQTGDLSKLTISKAFRGSIDEVAVFGQALNGDQIVVSQCPARGWRAPAPASAARYRIISCPSSAARCRWPTRVRRCRKASPIGRSTACAWFYHIGG